MYPGVFTVHQPAALELFVFEKVLLEKLCGY